MRFEEGIERLNSGTFPLLVSNAAEGYMVGFCANETKLEEAVAMGVTLSRLANTFAYVLLDDLHADVQHLAHCRQGRLEYLFERVGESIKLTGEYPSDWEADLSAYSYQDWDLYQFLRCDHHFEWFSFAQLREPEWWRWRGVNYRPLGEAVLSRQNEYTHTLPLVVQAYPVERKRKPLSDGDSDLPF